MAATSTKCALLTLWVFLIFSYVAVGQIVGTNIYYLPNSPYEYPSGIVAGPDGALWFTTSTNYTAAIGHIDLAGNIAEYQIPFSPSNPTSITVGSDGNVWFLDVGQNAIGRVVITANPPIITEIAVPTPNSNLGSITAGPDGALWFTEKAGNNIGRITTSGSISEYAVPTQGSGPLGITAGPDGALWFVEEQGNKVARITTTGSISEYTIPTVASTPIQITTGSDGNLWFTEEIGKIGCITPHGSFCIKQEVPVNSEPIAITTGPEGSLWFIDWQDVYYEYLGQMQTSGVFYTNSFVYTYPQALTSGPDGSIWLAEWYGWIVQAIPAQRRNGLDLCATCSVPSSKQLTDLQAAGVKYAVVEGAQNQNNKTHQILQAFQQYSNGGFTFGTAAYCFLYLYSPRTYGSGATQMKNCLASLQIELNAGSLSFVGLDVECWNGKASSCNPPAAYEPVSARVQDITEALDTLAGIPGVKNVVIYTTSSYWSFLTGNDSNLQQQAAAYPLWTGAAGMFTSYADPAGNYNCAPQKVKSLTPAPHTGTGVPSLTLPASITGLSITNNVVTFSAVNTFRAGQKVSINGLVNGYLNGQKLKVLASNLSPAQFSASFTHANVSFTSDSGTASLVLFGGWQKQSGVQYDIGSSTFPACLFGLEVDFDVFDPALFQ